MKVEVRGIEGIKGMLEAPPSKSYTHRAFIIASLADGTSTIKSPLIAGDTLSTLDALQAFGVKIERDGEIKIHGTGGELETPSKVIDCGNSGTTIRLISGISALDGQVTLTGDESVQKRPMQPLLDALTQLGVEAYSIRGDGTPPVVIKGGRVKGGEVRIRGDISSQFISSLLIFSPYAENDVRIEITTPLKSRPYIDMTLDVMERFGVDVVNKGYRLFEIKGQRYRATDYAVEGDYSSSSYFLALAALTNSEITVRTLLRESKQGDRAIVDILEEMGAVVEAEKDRVTVKGKGLQGIEVDLGDTPDLLPPLAALACKAEGKTVIKNVEHARYKETDRLSACAREFRKFGVEIEERRDGLTIRGKKKLGGADVYTYNDHRMAMALTIAALAAEGASTIEDVDCVDISFPSFFGALKELCPQGISL